MDAERIKVQSGTIFFEYLLFENPKENNPLKKDIPNINPSEHIVLQGKFYLNIT